MQKRLFLYAMHIKDYINHFHQQKELQGVNQSLYHGKTLLQVQEEHVLRLYGQQHSICSLAALKLSFRECLEGGVATWHRLTTHLPVGMSL
jgi:hypothetical protein